MANHPLNPISQRLPFNIDEQSVDAGVVQNLRYNTSSIVDLNQAIQALKKQVDAAHATANKAVSSIESATTSSGVTAFNTLAGNVTYFPNLFTVNDQLGNPSYTTQISDAGAKIIVGDSSIVTVTLNSSVGLPWGTFIDNDSSAPTVLVPASGTLYGEPVIPGGGFGLVFFDGTNWFCGAVKLATTSSPGYVSPDGVSIGIAGGVIRTIGLDSSVTTAKLTTGGTQGSMVFAKGLLISSVQAT